MLYFCVPGEKAGVPEAAHELAMVTCMPVPKELTPVQPMAIWASRPVPLALQLPRHPMAIVLDRRPMPVPPVEPSQLFAWPASMPMPVVLAPKHPLATEAFNPVPLELAP